jgi:DNA-binding NtrC family response regulator
MPRRYPRVSVNLSTEVESLGTVRKAQIANLAMNGALVHLAYTSDLDPLVNLQFSLPDLDYPIKTLAKVMRSTDEGIGLEFLDLDQKSRALLRSFLRSQLVNELKNCPFCNYPLLAGKQAHCSACGRPLNFMDEDYLEKLEKDGHPQEMIGTCDSMRQVFHLIRKVAATDVPILITGASGTGKELLAQAIHQRSMWSKGPFVAVNCGAIPRELLESELFGHEKGAFTGAYRTVMGTVERAQGGTLFLDEVGELPLELQVKILRFLQEYSFERVGGQKTIKVNVRIISATNCNLSSMISTGRFREDLYYRLDVVNIELPLLKERGEDAMIMANVFLKRYAAKIGKGCQGFSKDAITAIQAHSWPGNIRELINRIRRAVVMAETKWVTAENLGLKIDSITPTPFFNGLGLKEAKAKFESSLLITALERNHGNVMLTAKALKTSRSVIYHLMQKYMILESSQHSGSREQCLSQATASRL